MEIGEVIGIYVAQVVLTKAHLGFWGTLLNFYRGGAKPQFWEKFSTRFSMAAYCFMTGKILDIKNRVNR